MKMTRKLRTMALLLAVVGATMALSPAQSATNTISLTDVTNDVASRVVGCFRASAPATCPRDSANEPGNGQLDLTAGTFEGTAGHYLMSFTSRLPWPKQGDLPSALPGVSSLSVRWVFNNNAQQNRVENVNYSCTGKKSLPGYGNPDVEEAIKFNWNDNTASCGWLTEGPFPRSDGFTFFFILESKLVGGKFNYQWSWGWFEELTQIFYSQNVPNPHDDNVLVSDKGLVNGKTFASLVPGDLGTNTISLQVPYALRKDFSDDNDPSTNEEVTDYFGRPGQAIEGVTIGSYASANASVPDPGLCPADNDGWGALGPAGGAAGTIVSPVVRANAPAPYNDPENCYSQGVGLTITGDWIPGNPYQAGGPNWGGFLPRTFPRSLSYLPGAAVGNLNGLTCNYPLGLAALQPWVGYAPNNVSGTDVVTYMNGGTVTVAGGPTATIPALTPASSIVGSVNVPLPTGQYKACGNFYLTDGLHFVNASGPAQPTT